MVNERFDPTPLMEWLLGPGWVDGTLLQPAWLVTLLAVLTAGLCWLVIVLRRESV